MLERFDEDEKRVLREALRAAAEGPFFPDWEFRTLFGLDRSTVATIAQAWPNIDESSDEVVLAINNSLVNLVGYPHGEKDQWSKYISVSREEVLRILEKWKRQ